jgi:phenylpyruvate tautomerase PptA (4-oxalocrotonate tautomerase family)
MPLIRIDVVKGRSEAEIKALLHAAHRAVLEAFRVPLRDRYQIVTEHPRPHMVIEDTGLAIERSDKLVLVHVITRRRKKKQKEAFYRLLCEEFERECGIDPSDVMVTITENRDEDWSFGMGRAQFLTKELA